MYTQKERKRNEECKQFEKMHKRALENGETSLYKVYGRYSYAKERAEEYCRNAYAALDGKDFAIISHNSFMFTAGFYFEKVDEETGEVKRYFLRITPTRDEYWEVPFEAEE